MWWMAEWPNGWLNKWFTHSILVVKRKTMCCQWKWTTLMWWTMQVNKWWMAALIPSFLFVSRTCFVYQRLFFCISGFVSVSHAYLSFVSCVLSFGFNVLVPWLLSLCASAFSFYFLPLSPSRTKKKSRPMTSIRDTLMCLSLNVYLFAPIALVHLISIY